MGLTPLTPDCHPTDGMPTVRKAQASSVLKRRTGPPLAVDLVPADTKLAIRYAYLLDDDATIAKLAAKHDLSLACVGRILSGPEYETAKAEVEAMQVQAARTRLATYAEEAANQWRLAVPIAAKRGKHAPAKDLLVATRVIDPDQRAPHVTVQLGVQADTVAVLIGGTQVPGTSTPGTAGHVPAIPPGGTSPSTSPLLPPSTQDPGTE